LATSGTCVAAPAAREPPCWSKRRARRQRGISPRRCLHRRSRLPGTVPGTAAPRKAHSYCIVPPAGRRRSTRRTPGSQPKRPSPGRSSLLPCPRCSKTPCGMTSLRLRKAGREPSLQHSRPQHRLIRWPPPWTISVGRWPQVAERPGAGQRAPGRRIGRRLGDEPADEPCQRAKQLVQQANEADHIVERLQDRANQIAQGSG
jgi:hypothetical protein